MTYKYELWDGEKTVGYYVTSYTLHGNEAVIPILNEGKFERITVPLIFSLLDVISEGPKKIVTYKISLDVSRKSQRQINLLMSKNR